ncbi:hypothetical protein HDU67_006339 [Dinochytrium kinnereticum]|nr:hypothetical protein HDU67_006339 [Dinochytrium kinnereticum]
MTLISNLPQELLLAIFSKCDITSLVALSSTCSRFYSLSNDPSSSLQFPLLKRLVHLRYFGYLRLCLGTNTPASKSGEWLAHAIADTRIKEDVVFDYHDPYAPKAYLYCPSYQNSDPDYGIFDAAFWKAQAGSKRHIRIINEPGFIREPKRSGFTPLFYAILAGWVEGVKILVRRKTAVTDQDGHNRNLLHIAASSGSPSMLKLILGLYRNNLDRLATDLLHRDRSYRLPLHYACIAGFPPSEELTNLMLGTPYPHPPQGTNFQDIGSVMLQSGYRGVESPIFLCAQFGHTETLKAVVEHYQNTEAAGIFMHDPMNAATSLTPLHIAALSGHYGCVDYLLKAFPVASDAVEGVTGPRSGSSVDINCSYASESTLYIDSITPLLMACLGGHKDVVELLVHSHANVDGLAGGPPQGE